MDDMRTLAIDIGGTGVKAALLDASGKMLGQFLAELDRLRSLTECRLTLLQCDAAIQKVDELSGHDATETPGGMEGNRFRLVGGGGTDFRPVFNWVAGVVAASVFGASAAAQLVAGRIAAQRALAVGCAILVIGTAIIAAALHFSSLAALIAVLRGARTLVTISPLQPPERLIGDLAATGASYLLAPGQLWSEPAFPEVVAKLGAAGWSVEGDAEQPATGKA